MTKSKYSAQPKPSKPFNGFRAEAIGRGKTSTRPPMPTVNTFDPNDVILPELLTPSQERRVEQILDMIVSTGSAGYTDTMTVGTLIKVMLALDEIEEQLNQEGYIIEEVNAKTGMVVQKVHPAFAVRRTLFSEMRVMLDSFGLSPMTRRGLVRNTSADEPEEDPWDAALN